MMTKDLSDEGMEADAGEINDQLKSIEREEAKEQKDEK